MRNKIQYVKGTCKYILSPKYSSNLCRLRATFIFQPVIYYKKGISNGSHSRRSLYPNHLPRILVYHNISYIFIYKIRVFLFIWTESPLSSPMRFNHRISVWSLEGENDTAAGVRGVFELGWPPDETKRPYKNFLLRKATHESEREGSEKKKYSTTCRANLRRGASSEFRTEKRFLIYFSLSKCTLNCNFPVSGW